MSVFKPAETSESKLRLAIAALSGAGKTFTALSVATGIASITGSPIGLIDSEHGRSKKYARRFKFGVMEPFDYSVKTLIDIIDKAAKESPSPILIIDSLTHYWWDLCNEVEQVAQTKYRGNTWSAWSDPSTGTPMQRNLIDTILAYPNDLIATMRVDTEWSQEKDDRTGKTRPVKIGLKPVQGKGIEYEFDLMMSMTADHVAKVEKDGADLGLQDEIIEKPGEDFGRRLSQLLRGEQAKAPAKATKPVEPTIDDPKFSIEKIKLAQKLYKVSDEQVEQICAVQFDGTADVHDLRKDQAETLIPRVEAIGQLMQAIADRGVTQAQVNKAVVKLGHKKIEELSIDEADRMKAGVEKLQKKSQAA